MVVLFFQVCFAFGYKKRCFRKTVFLKTFLGPIKKTDPGALNGYNLSLTPNPYLKWAPCSPKSILVSCLVVDLQTFIRPNRTRTSKNLMFISWEIIYCVTRRTNFQLFQIVILILNVTLFFCTQINIRYTNIQHIK